MPPVRSTARVATNDRLNVQLNTIPSSTQRSQAQQQLPQYTASPTSASYPPPPPTFPSSFPNATSHGGYFVYVPPGTALPPSTHFYPYPVATPQQTVRDPDDAKEQANSDSRPEPPHYDEIVEGTPTSNAV